MFYLINGKEEWKEIMLESEIHEVILMQCFETTLYSSRGILKCNIIMKVCLLISFKNK
jgi:hypothetical protein